MWNIIESFVDQYGSSVNNVGKYWITMFNVLRLVESEYLFVDLALMTEYKLTMNITQI